MRTTLAALTAAAVLAAGCTAGRPADEPPGTVRLLFAGDVMLGRGVAPVLDAEGVEAFEAVRAAISSADVAAANLESPLTERPYAGAGFDLRADPGYAAILAAAGLDLLAVANNHAADGGAGTVADTLGALDGAGLLAAGAGEPPIVEHAGLNVAFLAYDLTGGGPAGEIDTWGPRVAADIGAARGSADVVTVGIHGGAEGLPGPDPVLERAVRDAALWGADVVWAHGAHAGYAVEQRDPDGDGRPAVVAYGLGDLVFDLPGTGLLLEVLAGAGGVLAWRVAASRHDGPRPGAPQWQLPTGAALAIDTAWWTLAAEPPAPTVPTALPVVPDVGGEVLAAAAGDVDGDGVDEVVVAFLRPFRETLVNTALGGVWVDAAGRTAHLGVYGSPAGEAVWVAGTLPRPVVAVVACDGALAVAYGEPGGGAPVATGAWTWNGFGFALTTDLPGAGVPRCVDVDGDGRTEAVVGARTGPTS